MKSIKKARGFAIRILVAGVCLGVLAFWVSGCGHAVSAGQTLGRGVAAVWTLGSKPEAHAQLGETEAEGRRRHLRNERINQQQLMADLDKFWLLDKPSKLTEKRIP
ncbi:MAG: hypothetical protein ACYS76_10185 [Planctomycetota bacterium]|jgi:hypothetical protein